MREAFPIELLKQVLDSTPEQQAEIGRFLGGRPFADRPQGAPASLGPLVRGCLSIGGKP